MPSITARNTAPPGDYKSGARIRCEAAPLLVDYAADRLRMLCAAAGFGAETDGVVETFQRLVLPWANTPLGTESKWLSEISDDNTPIEFSVAIADGHAEVRVLFEPQADEPTVGAHRAAGLALHERLEREYGADLKRFRIVQDLFLPADMQGPFAVWTSAVFAAGRPPLFKAYFNTQARGPERAQALVEEGMARLGLHPAAWSSLVRTALRRGPQLDELKYFALDLTSVAQARVKIYVRHHSATPEDLEVASSAADSHVPGEVLRFAREMRGGGDRMQARAPFTCASFVDVHHDRPASITAYIPVCAYARDDASVQRRVHDYLVETGLDPVLYDSVIAGFANRPLDVGVGMQSWVALQRHQGNPRITVYLSTEANRVHPPGIVPAPTPDYTELLRV